MGCLRNSQCRLKLLHIPTAAYMTFNSPAGKTIYPMDTIAFGFNHWVQDTLVRGAGEYVPYPVWVIKHLCGLYANTISQHFVIDYD
jgi:hypothetical protein